MHNNKSNAGASLNEDFGKDEGLIHEAIVTGRKVGAGHRFWAKLAHQERLFEKTNSFVTTNGYQDSPCQRLVREIMGRNFIGIGEALQCFDMYATNQELDQLVKTLPEKDKIASCVETDDYILVPGLPLTIMDTINLSYWGTFSPPAPSPLVGWFHNHRFATILEPKTEWYLLCKHPVQGKAILADGQTPKVCVLVYATALYYMITGNKLFKGEKVYCDENIPFHGPVYIGFDIPGERPGLFIGYDKKKT
ncbi:MAG: hypothetical protein WC998_03255 [Candidatus Paceibacterota bacterium]|jgi:hypothetical protein